MFYGFFMFVFLEVLEDNYIRVEWDVRLFGVRGILVVEI